MTYINVPAHPLCSHKIKMRTLVTLRTRNMSRFPVIGAALLLWMSLPAASQQSAGVRPSFDCTGARIGAERTICAHPDLAQLDQVMAELYGQAKAARTDAAQQALAEEQKQWLRLRNACGANHACLARVHRERIQQLYPGFGAIPAPPESQGTRMVVNVPQLNVFDQPSVYSRRVGELAMGDSVMAHQTRLDPNRETWTWACTKRFCGWVAAEFLQLPPRSAGAPPTDRSQRDTTERSSPPLEGLPDIEGLEKLK